MSATIPSSNTIATLTTPWRRQLGLLGGLVLLLIALFWRDAADMAAIWWSSSSFNHCLFIPPIIAWLVWQRAYVLAVLQPRSWAWGLLPVLTGSLLWILGEAAGLAVLRHIALVLMAQGLVLAILGPVVCRALLFPIAYSLFLIPVGSEAEPFLQILTAHMTMAWLNISGVPAFMQGIFITTPNGYFRVAEACSGTAFLIAMNAYAVLAANQCFKSGARRIGFWAFAMLTCLFANGIRAFGIIFIAYHSSVDSAVVVDHVVYGWLFFAVVIVLVMVVGARWFDRRPGDPWLDVGAFRAMEAAWPAPRLPALIAPGAALMLALPLLWSMASNAGGETLPERVPLPRIAGWTQISDPASRAWEPQYASADRILVAHFRDTSGAVVDLALVQFERQGEGKELVGHGHGAAALDGQGDWLWSAPARGPALARAEQLTGPEGRLRLAYSFFYVDGTLTGNAAGVKLATLRARLLGGDQRAVAVLVSSEYSGGPEAESQAAAALDRFLAALGPVDAFAARSLASD